TCAPTGTPYCSDHCSPCPTIRPFCPAQACGSCIANPVCGAAQVCLPTNNPNVSGCCTCATVTPSPTPKAVVCSGDCDNGGDVDVTEIITLVNIILGSADSSA